MASFTGDKKISPINDMIRAGINSDKSIYILINEVLSAHGKEELCQFQRSTDGTNPKRLWNEPGSYTDEIANKYNHFTGKLISVCESLNKTSCDIDAVREVSGDIAKADKTSDEAEIRIRDLFDNLELKADDKIKLGGQSGGSPFSNVLAIAMRISKMDDPSEALNGIDKPQIKSWLESLTQKAIDNKLACVAFLYNNVLAQVFPSIVASLKLTEAAVADPETIVAFLRTYIPIFINRIQEASITVGDAVETGAKMGAKAETGAISAIDHMKTSATNLALSDLSSKMRAQEDERFQKKTDRLASLETVQKRLTDAKVKAADLKTELEGQKEILKKVKTIVAETKTFIEKKDMMSEELTQINKELELLMEEPEKQIENQGQKLKVANAVLIPPTAPPLSEKEQQAEEHARIEQQAAEQARIEKRSRGDDETGDDETGDDEPNKRPKPNESKEGGKRKTKKQQKKASKTKKPKRSQKKQTKKRKQRKTQQKKGKK